ncbi:hypothetical protein G6K88_31860 [Agrobacterium rhizogenes]|uniref:hypothetical protein n=1 Tax=Rhizobium rhizogenes TaxID=359 RepID=UPI001572A45C|nr:hypothetical protein [Rhizobium rhizogenes]NTF59573.1 hypothetical protein [Rhizobium rhizogenes]NTF79133.1 hypothetical protein [Rhizobium rhizogenes]NTG04790.1 hypothetical protein [Rhizobium rhizogenes]NTG18389.1 hypothetical protein [Rhizobium rhizogenes]NTG32120.1 hypothetical protein [Rhizobium rhizogenes]
MSGIFMKAALIGLLVVGSSIAAVEPAAAQVWGDGWGSEDAPPPPWERRPRYEPPASWNNVPRSNDSCSPEDALRRARDYGVKRPAIERFSSRWVYVGGLREGDYAQVILKNTPGCPYTDH